MKAVRGRRILATVLRFALKMLKFPLSIDKTKDSVIQYTFTVLVELNWQHSTTMQI